jgi:hypothetical protein
MKSLPTLSEYYENRWQEWQGSNLRPPVLETERTRGPVWLRVLFCARFQRVGHILSVRLVPSRDALYPAVPIREVSREVSGERMSPPLLQSLFGFLAAAIGWLTLEFLGRPLRRFFDLRGETVELLTRIANVRAPKSHIAEAFHPQMSTVVTRHRVETLLPELTASEIDALANARKDLRTLASKFRAFALNETVACKVAGMLGYDADLAGRGLIGLSNRIDTYGVERTELKKMVSKALQFAEFDI